MNTKPVKMADTNTIIIWNATEAEAKATAEQNGMRLFKVCTWVYCAHELSTERDSVFSKDCWDSMAKRAWITDRIAEECEEAFEVIEWNRLYQSLPKYSPEYEAAAKKLNSEARQLLDVEE